MVKVFDKKDFSKLRYNIEDIPEGDNILDHFSDLKQVFESYKKEHNQKMFRYIIFMYDKNSPFVKKFNSFEKRFKEAATYAGFENVDDEKFVESVFHLKDQDVKQMVVDFCILLSDLKYASLIQNYHTYYEIESATLEYVTDVKDDEKRLTALKSKCQLLELSDKIAERVDKYEQEIFMGNEDVINEAKTGRITPEMMAAQKNRDV